MLPHELLVSEQHLLLHLEDAARLAEEPVACTLVAVNDAVGSGGGGVESKVGHRVHTFGEASLGTISRCDHDV